MGLLKCKMCGGSLNVADGVNVIECDYCGTQQTLPKTTDAGVQSLFNRANMLRQKNEFDKAEAVYEKILEIDATEAEAYWGVILCKFGIEYVEDPKTFKRIPTCHRTSYDSIIADPYYKKALECADSTQRAVYEAEAKVIDGIQKGILAISAQEEPYDVFICYKETDENGKRTHDSVIANDIYYQLKNEGFKVFYAAITLEDKLGSAYEPIIFAALSSAKVMLALGTRAEYFNAVWVKNEWSRFIKMMKNDRSKVLIPCYKDMEAYELPEEFAHLQAQDMSKIGFINDIVRGIKKVIVKETPADGQTTVIKETVVADAKNNVEPIIKRAYIFVKDGDWENANGYCEKALDLDPENADAYLIKLMVDLRIRRKEELASCDSKWDENKNYEKVMLYGDTVMKSEIDSCLETVKERRRKREQEAAEAREKRSRMMKKLAKISAIAVACCAVIVIGVLITVNVITPSRNYSNAERLFADGKYYEASEAFKALGDYKDSHSRYEASLEAYYIDLYGAEDWEAIVNTKVGDVLAFGKTEQDGDTANGAEDIEWIVVEKSGTRVLVVSKKAIAAQMFHSAFTNVEWSNSEIRKWLNGKFMQDSFTDTERERIIQTAVPAAGSATMDTHDYLFLLSESEAEKYLMSLSEMDCRPTTFAIDGGAYYNYKTNNCWWWLRDTGSREAKYIDDYGDVQDTYVNSNSNAVRPAMWFDLDQ